mgnify:CR=1 FL=1
MNWINEGVNEYYEWLKQRHSFSRMILPVGVSSQPLLSVCSMTPLTFLSENYPMGK